MNIRRLASPKRRRREGGGLSERLLGRAIGNAGTAEAIIGDLIEERIRWRSVRVFMLAFRFALQRRPQQSRLPAPRSKPMSTILQDVRYAARVLVRQPGFSLIVIVTLAVGLGANAAVLAMVDGMLFRPLPVADLDGMVQVFETNAAQNDDREGVSPPDYLDWRQQSRSFEHLLAIEFWEASLSDRAQDPEQVVARRVSAPFFDSLRVRLASGRGFLAAEETIGSHRVVVISDRLWLRRWGRSPALLGSTITIDREPYTVVGIAPEGFDYPSGANLWGPITFTDQNRTQRSRRYLEVIGRLKPDVTFEAASRELEAIGARIAQEHPDTNKGYGINVLRLSWAMLDVGTPQVFAVLQLAVVLVLLIAGANVANLLMVRGAARHREMALRLAVGASRWRIVRQLVVESVLLSAVGVLLAIPISAFGLRAIKNFMPPEIAGWILGWGEVDVDGRLLGATMAIGLVAGAVFGVLPALRASRPDLVDALKDGARGSGGSRRRMLQGFVVAQVALALALLVSAGMTTRGAINLLLQHDGYDPRGVMTFGISLPDKTYVDDGQRLRFFERVVERVRALPQVEYAAFTSSIPFGEHNSARPVEVEGRPIAQANERPVIDVRTTTPDYLRVLRANVIRGRALTAADRGDAPKVALIDENMAARLWPDADPIGKRFRATSMPDAPWLTVVGIVSNVKHSWFAGYRPTYYVTYQQMPIDYGVLAVRVRGDETAIAPAVRQVFRELDADLPVAKVHSLLRWRELRTVGMQMVAGLIAAFAGIGLFLSAIGIYGVMAYSVSQRTREIGVRMALGATARGVMGMTLRDAAMLSALGILVGFVAAFGLAKLLVASMFGVVQLDVTMFVVFAAVLAAVALVASSVPAWRAMRVDPISALRAE